MGLAQPADHLTAATQVRLEIIHRAQLHRTGIAAPADHRHRAAVTAAAPSHAAHSPPCRHSTAAAARPSTMICRLREGRRFRGLVLVDPRMIGNAVTLLVKRIKQARLRAAISCARAPVPRS